MAAEDVLDEELENTSSEKKGKKDKKKEKKNKKKGQGELPEEEKETVGGKIVLFVVTLVILLIWLAIVAILVKTDIGGFGSTVLYPVFKDVPYLNMILPDVDKGPEEDEKYSFDSIEEAVDYIKELEKELQASQLLNNEDAKTIDELSAQVQELQKYKQEQENFETLRDKFYNDVLYYTSDQYDLYSKDSLVVLEAYRQYFEEIEPAKAEGLYKQVVTQLENADKYDDYVNKYANANMKPKEAAAIFDEMCEMNEIELVADILNHMGVQDAGAIIAKMDTKNSAKVTVLLKPELR